MITWTTFPSPFGLCLAAATDRGLREIKLGIRDKQHGCTYLVRQYGNATEDSRRLSRFLRQVERYFSSGRVAWDIPCDRSWMTPWERRVYSALQRVPAGRVISYGDLAMRAGSPGAARAVGLAMSRNQLPIVIPCHRVIASDGSLGGFSAGLAIKKFLLDLERGTV